MDGLGKTEIACQFGLFLTKIKMKRVKLHTLIGAYGDMLRCIVSDHMSTWDLVLPTVCI